MTKFEIPNEIIDLILTFCYPKDVIKMSWVSKDWQKSCFSDFYWKQAFKKSFEDYYNYNPNFKGSFYSLFKENLYLKSKHSFCGELQTTKTFYKEPKLVYKKNINHFMNQNFTSFCFFDEKIYFNFDQKIVCISKKNFKELWSINIEYSSFTYDIFTQSLICEKNCNFTILSLDKKVTSKIELNEGKLTSWIVLNGVIICLIYFNNLKTFFLKGISLESKELWSLELKDVVSTNPTIYNHENSIILLINGDMKNYLLSYKFQSFSKTPIYYKYEVGKVLILNFMKSKLYFIENEKTLMNLNLDTGDINSIISTKNDSYTSFYFNKFKNEIIQLEIKINFQRITIFDESFVKKTSKKVYFDGEFSYFCFTRDGNILISLWKEFERPLLIYDNDLNFIDKMNIEFVSNNYSINNFYDDLILISSLNEIGILQFLNKEL